MIDKIERIAFSNPSKIAYKVNDASITYSELWNSANYYAQFLQKQGNSPVIIYGHKEINVIISILACIIANRPYVPIGCCTPRHRLKQIVELTKSSLILTNMDVNISETACIRLNDLQKYEKNSNIKQNNDIVYIMFTSGSTGVPKGVPISRDNLNNFVDWISGLEPLCNYENINVLNQASFSFDLSVADLFYALCNSHTLIAFDKDIPEGYDEIFEVMKDIDVAVMTPTFMKLCLLNEDFNEKTYPRLKCVYFCGEQLEPSIVKNIYKVFPNIKILNAYGPTEATSAVSATLITKKMANELSLLPVGDAINFATDIEIENNEIILKGKSVFGGYLSSYVGGYYCEKGINCYRTGDVGYIKDGKLYCKGRLDRQIKYKGYRIELDEIENAFKGISGIRDCAVVAKYDGLIVKTIKSFVVLNDNIDITYIKSELKKIIPGYMVPKTIKILDRLPINSNGKIDRKALSEL